MNFPRVDKNESQQCYFVRCLEDEGVKAELKTSAAILNKASIEYEFASNLHSWDVEIFAVGKWNGISITEKVIDNMILNFSALSSIHTPPLKFGHNEKQPIQAQDGQMALGWIKNIWKAVGKEGVPTLFAKFTDVPNIVYEIVKSKRYKEVSIELLYDVIHNGVKYNYVLDAVALLGADKPAVNILADMTHYMSVRSKNLAFSKMVSFSSYESFKPTKESTMDIDQKEYDRLKALETSHATLVASSAATEAKFASDLEAEKKINLTAAAKFARDNIIAILDAGVVAMQITPSQKASFSTILGIDDDVKVITIDTKVVKDFVEGNKAASGNKGDTMRTGDKIEFTEATAGDVIDHKVKKLQVDSGMKLSYSDALNHVCAAEPELAKAHQSATGQE